MLTNLKLFYVCNRKYIGLCSALDASTVQPCSPSFLMRKGPFRSGEGEVLDPKHLCYRNKNGVILQIKNVIHGGPAHRDGILQMGDVLVYVNNECVLGATQAHACHIFQSIGVGELVTLQICRGYPLLFDPTNKVPFFRFHKCMILISGLINILNLFFKMFQKSVSHIMPKIEV